jgi:uncharacterized coiled-coil DUF342 family protein
MDFAVKIAALISLSAFTVLCLYLLITLSKFSKLIDNANALFNDMKALLLDFKDKLNFAVTQINDAKAKVDNLFISAEELKVKAIQSLKITDDAFIQGKKTALLLEKEIEKLSQTMEPYHLVASKISSKVVPPMAQFSGILSSAKKMVGKAFNFPSKLLRTL